MYNKKFRWKYYYYFYILGECLDNNFHESKLNEIIKNILSKIEVTNDIKVELIEEIKIYLNEVKEFDF